MPLLAPEIAIYVVLACVLARVCTPHRRPVVLLAASYGFAAMVDTGLLQVLLCFTLSNAALLAFLERAPKPWFFRLVVLSNIAFLLVLQSYAPDAPGYADPPTATLFERFSPDIAPMFGIGAAFYVVQAIDCATAVYRGQLRGVTLVEYGLLLGFFPKLLAGPFLESSAFLERLRSSRDPNVLPRPGRGARSILFGLFLKLAVANRVGAFSDPVLSSGFDGVVLAAGTYLLVVQISCDVLAYLAIARGLAEIVGLPLDGEERGGGRPWAFFFRPWYPALVGWFQDSVYRPLVVRGIPRPVAILCVFVAIGVWHRPTLDLVAVGAYLGCVQLGVNKFREVVASNAALRGWVVRGVGWIVGFHAVALGLLALRLESVGATWDSGVRMVVGVGATLSNLEHLGRGRGVIGPMPDIVTEGQMVFPVLLLGWFVAVAAFLRGRSIDAWYRSRSSRTRSLVLAGLALGVAILGRGGDIAFFYCRF